MKLSRIALAGLLSAAGMVAAATAATAGQASTTRIEPRAVYGAVVTVEKGVRVYRPLPPVRHVIINPNGTPLNLTIEERREISRNYHYYNSSGEGGSSSSSPAAVGGLPYGYDGYGARGARMHKPGGGVGVHGFRGYRPGKGQHGGGRGGHRAGKGGGGKGR